MDGKKRRALAKTERERQVGIDPEDEAGRWLAEHDPRPEPAPPKSPLKSKALHRWRQQRQRQHGER